MKPTDVLMEMRLINEAPADCLPAAPFFVTAEMHNLAHVASLQWKDQELCDGDWPAPVGWLRFDNGFTYTPDERDDPIVTTLAGFGWELRDTAMEVIPFTQSPYTGRLQQWECQGSRGIRWRIGEMPPLWGDNNNYCTRLLLTTWTIMQQRLASVTEARADRAERRRRDRLGLPPQTVTVVRVRTREKTHTSGDGEPVEWSHRWLVNGHWRNQYLPSRGAHRQQWITGYVKGPADKPLVVKDRVTAWVR